MGPYQLLEEIARGGMGVVYRARHTTLGRVVALKTLRADGFGDPQARRRFAREMRAAGRLNHPHIVTVYEVGDYRGQPYYTMAFIAGGSLARHVARLRGDPRASLVLMEKVARAVHYAHEQGVLHRDLKPGNVLLDERGEPLVADFGLAKLLEGDEELTQTGIIPGTPAYMAPEQAGGLRHEVGPAADVWALGVILYELLAGRRPFAASNHEELKRQIGGESPPPLQDLRPELDPGVGAVVARCLEKEPGRRYASAGALADDLARFLRGEPPLTLWARRPREPAGRPRRRVLSGLAAVAALLGALTVGIISFRPPERTEGPRTPGPQPIVLIGESGLPQTSRWLVGEHFADFPAAAPGKPFTVRNSELGLLELGKPPWDHFRLEADVLHLESVEGEVGIFLAYSGHPAPDGTHHSFCTVCFADVGNRFGHRDLAHAKYQDFPANQYYERPVGRRPSPPAWAAPAPGVECWRHIAVNVTADGVVAWWGRQRLGEASLAEVADLRRRVLQNIEANPGPVPVRGGLGVFVYDGAASFKNVVLRPLP
jgi:hypothetical protein